MGKVNSEKDRIRQRAWREANKERLKLQKAAYHEANREKKRAYDRAYRLANLEKKRAYLKVYREANREKMTAYLAVYYTENADKMKERQKIWRQTLEGKASVRAVNARRRAREKDLDCGCVNKEMLARIWEHDEGLCYACGEPGEHYEHVVPLAAGGPHCSANLRVSCASCNLSKGRWPLERLVEKLQARGVELSPRIYEPGVPCPLTA